MNTNIPIQQFSEGLGRKERRKLEREIGMQRNKKPPRFMHNKTRPWQAIEHMINKHDTSLIPADMIEKNDMQIFTTLSIVFGKGSNDPDDLASLEQYSLVLFFLTHQLIDATKPDDMALAMPQWNECLESAEAAQVAHIAMQQRFNKTGHIGWTAQDRLATEDCAQRISELFKLASLGMARMALVQAKSAIDNPNYKANRKAYLEAQQ